MKRRILLEVSEKPSKTTPETSDYGDFSRKSGIPPTIKRWAGKKITEISPTIINLCNLYLIAGIKRALKKSKNRQSSLLILLIVFWGIFFSGLKIQEAQAAAPTYVGAGAVSAGTGAITPK